MGRLDAVIETVSDYPGVILVAEWESNAFTVFGPGKELEKLWLAAENQKYADAFLFTYCPFNRLSEFITQTVDFWQSKTTSRETFPQLFLTVIATRKRMRDDEFIFMRTLEIDSDIVSLWHDLGFVELDDYRSCLESENLPPIQNLSESVFTNNDTVPAKTQPAHPPPNTQSDAPASTAATTYSAQDT